jgi:hypothetical protein
MFKKVIVGVLGFSAIAALAGPSASARGVASDATDPLFLNQSCWNGFPMLNRCSTSESLWYELPVDTSGAKTVSVVVNAVSSANNVQCIAIGFAANGSAASYSSAPSATVFGTTSTLSLTGSSIPAGGFLIAECIVGVGSSVYSLNWNQ